MTVPVEPQKALRCGHGLAFSPKIGSFHRLREEPDPDGTYRWMPCDRPPEPSAVEDWRAAMPGRREDPTFDPWPEPSAAEEDADALMRRLLAEAEHQRDYPFIALLLDKTGDALAAVADRADRAEAERDAARAELARLRQQTQAAKPLIDEHFDLHVGFTPYDSCRCATCLLRAALGDPE